MLLTSSIIPRPIAFISSLSGEGVPNLAPMRYDRCAYPMETSTDATLTAISPWYVFLERLTQILTAHLLAGA